MPLQLPDRQLELIVRTLPAAPRILAQLAPQLQALDTDVPDVTRTIRRDSGLTARLIDVANSAAFTGFEPATSLEDAVSRLGFRETYRIVGAVASTQLADEPLFYYAMQPQRLRQNAVFAALVMEQLAGTALVDPATAYTVGLLRSIGKIALDRLARQSGIIAKFDPAVQPLVAWETANWGCSNAHIAAHVLEIWDFPVEAIDAVRFQYDPTAGSSRAAHLLNIAAGTAQAKGLGLPGEESYWRTTPEALEQAGVNEEKLSIAVDHATIILSRISSVFA